MKYVGQHPFKLLTEPENKLVFLATVEYAAFEQVEMADGQMSLNFLDEKLRTQTSTFSMKKFSPFFEEFKDKIQIFIEMGLMTSSLKGNFEQFRIRHERINDLVPPLVLNFNDLEIGFLFCLVPLALSVVAFVCELAPRMKKLAVKTRDFFTAWFLIRAVVKTKKGLT